MQRSDYKQAARALELRGRAGAYGPEFPLGDRLVALASDDSREAEQALDEVLGHAGHQDVLEEVAPEVVSLFLDALRVADFGHGPLVLRGLVDLMRAAWTWPVPFGFIPRTRTFQGPSADTGERAWQDGAYDALSDRVQDALAAGLPVLVEHLDAPDLRARALAARLVALAVRSDSARTAEAALGRAHAVERHPTVRGALLVSLAVVRRGLGDHADTRVRAEAAAAGPNPLERACGCTALLLAAPEQALGRYQAEVLRSLRLERVDRMEFPWGDGHPAELVAEALSVSTAPGEEVAEVLLQALLDWVEQARADPASPARWTVEGVATRLTERVFRVHLGRHDYVTATELDPLQRVVVAGIMGLSPPLLATYPFDFCGFRNVYKDGERLVGLVRGGLDLEMEGMWAGRVVTWPLWKWWHQARLVDSARPRRQPSLMDAVLGRMRRQLAPRQIWAAALDAAGGAYDVTHTSLVYLVAELAHQLEDELHRFASALGPEPDGREAALAVIPGLTLLAAVRNHVDAMRKWSILLPLVERVIPAELKAEAIAEVRRLFAEQ